MSQWECSKATRTLGENEIVLGSKNAISEPTYASARSSSFQIQDPVHRVPGAKYSQ